MGQVASSTLNWPLTASYSWFCLALDEIMHRVLSLIIKSIFVEQKLIKPLIYLKLIR